ncbi:MAG: hypothetical protein HOP31_06640, partial [Ignavibacteria bacterium]|nr:hypothetical protein [Ignavibacteria bacterium]
IYISLIPLALFFILAAGAIWQNKTENIQKKDTVTDKKRSDTEVKKELADKEESSEKEVTGPADTVKVGAYIFSLYDLDFPGNKLNADFYLWYNTKKDSMDLLQNLEIINSIELNKSYEMNEKRGSTFFHSVRINAKIKEEWNVTDFPFDEQVIEIKIEDFDKDNTKLVFVADTAASKIDKDVHLDGWKIKDFGITIDDHTYETNYGDPDIPLTDYSAFSRATMHFTLEREGKGLFFKLFVGLFISVLISLLTFFINPLDLDPRFGLSVGAIFAAIASQYVITSSLPQNESLTLVDILHDITFIYIFLCILVSTISLHYMKQGKEVLSQKLDRISFFIFAVSYIGLIIYFVGKAI